MLRALRAVIGLPATAGTREDDRNRFAVLREEMADISRDVKSLRLEWEETYESVNRALRKMAKREKRAEPCGCEEKESGEAGPGASRPNGHQAIDPARLSAIRGRWG